MKALLAATALILSVAPAGAQDHSGHDMADMPDMDMSVLPPPADVHEESRPSTVLPGTRIPAGHAAEALFDPAAMARARAMLSRESGGMLFSMLLVDLLETRWQHGRNGYRWEGEAWFGGDIDRLTIKTQGEGMRDRHDDAEVQALWSHAIDPWFNLQLGVRQDFRPAPARTYASVGIEGLAPYWFKLAATAFLSDKGKLTARAEASHDIRLTQRLLLTPRAEVNLSAGGAMLREAELGARLGYMIEPRFTPYIGVEWSRIRGSRSRAADQDRSATRVVTGLRFWF
ncbi:copper resistance protein B [Sphingobium sp. AN558]|uniref:copper resistance protein B n=1 Tax=Sphingobium sp. AN558 TaxID=3133442 RepID=UPI0030C13036